MQHPAARSKRGALLALVVNLQALACTATELPQTSGSAVASCCSGRGSCLPSAFVEPRYEGLLSGEACSGEALCVPDELRQIDVPRSCHASINGAEGRCLPSCLPSVEMRGDQLSQDGCSDFQVCVPCYDPTTGESTRACSLGNDTGAVEPPKTFASCCGNLGRCVPNRVVPADQREQLGGDSCSEPLSLCAPLESLLKGMDYVPASCTTVGLGTEGRCLPACLPALSEQKQRLGQSSCESGHLCAPCFDPLTLEPTGSCSIAGDPGPLQPPKSLESCCEGIGHCTPSKLLSELERERLGPDSCSAGEALCVPDELAVVGARPTSCTVSSIGAEGRCLADCLPQIAAQRTRLTVETCPAHHLCSPCVDPVTGVETGACDLAQDPGPTREPVVFPGCCGARARCVPEAALSETQQGQLQADSCTAGQLCVPLELALDPELVPPSCTVSASGSEGRCLSECLPQIATQSDRLKQDQCEEHHLCAPCIDPVTGLDTGACHIGKDPGPKLPPVLFAGCCSDQARCVPLTSLSSMQATQLGRDTCSAQEACVPLELAKDPALVSDRCTVASIGAEGRCLSECLPQIAGQSGKLSRDGCKEHHLCAPCSDPITGMLTGACSLGGDPGPQDGATVFASCCGNRARCLPSSSVPAKGRGLLAQDSCESEQLCVPLELAINPDGVPMSCSVSALRAEGRCLSTCLPAVAERKGTLQQDGCHQDQACVPCFDPLTGVSTGACSVGQDPGPSSPAVTLAGCCGGVGRCTPKAWVPASQTANFGADSCADTSGQLCVAPSAALSDPGFVPASCADERTGAEGRCLPSCLPPVAARAAVLSQASCGSAELCTPCYDPFTGAPTGACSTGADPGPKKPAFIFETCCGTGAAASGVCVPAALVPAGAPELPAQSCSEPGTVCAPRTLASNPSTKFPTCSALLGPGVCIDSCYIDPFIQVFAPAADCAANQNCVPCSLLGGGIAGC